jgi:hypothetical protein
LDGWRAGWADTLDARYKQSGQKMLAAVWFLYCDLRNIVRGSQYEIRMINSILLAVSHSDDKRNKWAGLQ